MLPFDPAALLQRAQSIAVYRYASHLGRDAALDLASEAVVDLLGGPYPAWAPQTPADHFLGSLVGRHARRAKRRIRRELSVGGPSMLASLGPATAPSPGPRQLAEAVAEARAARRRLRRGPPASRLAAYLADHPAPLSHGLPTIARTLGLEVGALRRTLRQLAREGRLEGRLTRVAGHGLRPAELDREVAAWLARPGTVAVSWSGMARELRTGWWRVRRSVERLAAGGDAGAVAYLAAHPPVVRAQPPPSDEARVLDTRVAAWLAAHPGERVVYRRIGREIGVSWTRVRAAVHRVSGGA